MRNKMNIYVGNLSFDVTEDELQQAFAEYGQVGSVSLIKDTYTGKSRGFAFVEMPDSGEAQNAMNALNNKELKGRALRVSEARPREQRSDWQGRGQGGGQRSGGFQQRRSDAYGTRKSGSWH
jgi:RNA recognition motif-containing protein